MIKTSSMGDVIHTLPALTDALRAMPGLRFDWVVEEAFAEIPGWHPAVARVIPVGLRRWRRDLWHTLRTAPWRELKASLREQHYTAAVDAQGLLKSAWIGLLQPAPRMGYDCRSAREPLSALLYQQRFTVPGKQHAVERVRQLLAQALRYPLPATPPDYGIDTRRLPAGAAVGRNLVFLHATTRPDKHWPEPLWHELCDLALGAGYAVRLPWADALARERAERIADGRAGVEVLPRMGLTEVAGVLNQATAAVAVDTGLGHLAAALGVPCVSLYGATDPGLIGALGRRQVHLSSAPGAPPFDGITAQRVWGVLQGQLLAGIG